jgi:hypothetical protein
MPKRAFSMRPMTPSAGPVGWIRPRSTRSPSPWVRAASFTSSSNRRVLPSPFGATTVTTRGSPSAIARPSAVISSARGSSRPTSPAASKGAAGPCGPLPCGSVRRESVLFRSVEDIRESARRSA